MDAEREHLIVARMALAAQKIDSGKAEFDRGDWRETIGRSYYAMFQAARAVLLFEGYETRTHRGVTALFGQHFVRTGQAADGMGRDLSLAQRSRHASDYDETAVFEQGDARETLEAATRFVDWARRWLADRGIDLTG